MDNPNKYFLPADYHPTEMTPEEVRGYLDEARYARAVYYSDMIIPLAEVRLKTYPWEYDLKGMDDYSGIDFTGIWAPRLVMVYAKLSGAIFDEADLTGCFGNPCMLDRASFQRAILKDAMLDSAHIYYSQFQEAKMQGSTLSDADAWHCNFRQADLSEADLAQGRFDSSWFVESILKNADLQWADLTWCNLRGADLRGANLENANLTQCNFTGANLTDAILKEADLTMCDFTEANLTNVEFGEAIMHGVKLHGAIYEWRQISWVRFLHAIPKKNEDNSHGWY